MKLLNSGSNKLVLNLQSVEFLSSAGLRAMVRALKEAQKSGGNIHLVSVSQPIEVILRTVGMMQMFAIHANELEAASSF